MISLSGLVVDMYWPFSNHCRNLCVSTWMTSLELISLLLISLDSVKSTYLYLRVTLCVWVGGWVRGDLTGQSYKLHTCFSYNKCTKLQIGYLFFIQ